MNRYTTFGALLAAIVVLVAMKLSDAPAANSSGNPVELGTVSWERDLDRGLEIAKKKKRDVFLLFQEVPG